MIFGFISVREGCGSGRPAAILFWIKTLEQFPGRGRGGADLADDDAGGVVGEDGRFYGRCASRYREGERGNHRVAGAGNVEHLLRHRGNVERLLPALAEQHAQFAERDEQERRTQFVEEPFRHEHEVLVR